MLAFKWSWAVPERSGVVPGSSRARNNEFSMVLGGFGGRVPWARLRARYGGAVRSGPLNPKIKPYTPGTGTGLGCLLSGLSPVHGHGLLAVWPLTSTGAWAEAVCCLTLTHAVAQSAVADIEICSNIFQFTYKTTLWVIRRLGVFFWGPTSGERRPNNPYHMNYLELLRTY